MPTAERTPSSGSKSAWPLHALQPQGLCSEVQGTHRGQKSPPASAKAGLSLPHADTEEAGPHAEVSSHPALLSRSLPFRDRLPGLLALSKTRLLCTCLSFPIHTMAIKGGNPRAGMSQWGLGRLRQEQLSCRGETKWLHSPTPSGCDFCKHMGWGIGAKDAFPRSLSC